MPREKIDITKYRGNSSDSYTGRPEGKDARKDLGLSKRDKDDLKYSVEIPTGTTAFNPSFFLGLFFDSIKNLGMDSFKHKYEIIVLEESEDLKAQLTLDISEGMRHARNQLKPRGGLFSFIKR